MPQKKFSNKQISVGDLEKIIEAINLSASSIGMQTYRLIVVKNTALKRKLGEGSFNSQIADCSHLLVFAAFDSVSQENIDNYVQLVAKERKTLISDLLDLRETISNYLLARSDEENFSWSSKQAYIGLGTGLIAAAELKIDATPMEGFDAEKFDKLLGLNERKLKSAVLLALGYRDMENDYLAPLKKVRISEQEMATIIN